MERDGAMVLQHQSCDHLRRALQMIVVSLGHAGSHVGALDWRKVQPLCTACGGCAVAKGCTEILPSRPQTGTIRAPTQKTEKGREALFHLIACF